MQTLILDRKNIQLHNQGRQLIIRRPDETPRSIPLRMIERIVISARTEIDSQLLYRLAEQGIGLIVINPRQPDDYALLSGAGHNDATRRIIQLKASEDPQTSAAIARRLVRRKLKGQRRLLKQQARKMPALRKPLLDTAEQLRRTREKIRDQQPGIDSLLGLEGAAAAAYFKAFGRLFGETWGFNGRNRRPPKDPINALLSLGYTLADGLANQALLAAGWDPMIGFYHRLSWSRRSFSSDLLEPLRPSVDAWVLRLVHQQQLRPGHFTRQNQGCYLDKAGRRIFYGAWATEAVPELKKALADNLRPIHEQLLPTD